MWLTHFIKRMLPGEYCTKSVLTRRPHPTQRGPSPSDCASPITWNSGVRPSFRRIPRRPPAAVGFTLAPQRLQLSSRAGWLALPSIRVSACRRRRARRCGRRAFGWTGLGLTEDQTKWTLGLNAFSVWRPSTCDAN